MPPFLSRWFKAAEANAAEASDGVPMERLVREYARQMRVKLRKRGGGNNLQADRFARAKSRAALRGIRAEKPRQLEKDILISRYRPSPILDRLLPHRESNWAPIMQRDATKSAAAIDLLNFSFLTHPAATLEALKQIARVEAKTLSAVLNFHDEHCLDAGSFLVLAEVFPRLAPVFIGGRMPRGIQKVLDATGVGRHNRMKLAAIEPDAEDQPGGRHADVWAFPLQRRRPALSSRSPTVHLEPQKREVAADRFCNAVNEWLGVPEIDQELTQDGRGWLAAIIGELLCNAERHSQQGSNDGDWSTTAFMVRRLENGQAVLKCHIAFLSVGRSFAESLGDAASDVQQALERYVDQHAHCGLSPDSLATVFALQDTITCDPAAREARSGGTGLQDVLDFVHLLGGDGVASAGSRVTIVSGRTCIQLTRPYIPGRRKGPDMPRLQWCNSENSSHQPPDGSVVSDLPEHFAGTLVSVAFTLDPEYLAANMESGDDVDDRP